MIVPRGLQPLRSHSYILPLDRTSRFLDPAYRRFLCIVSRILRKPFVTSLSGQLTYALRVRPRPDVGYQRRVSKE